MIIHKPMDVMCGLGTPVKRYLSLTVLCLYPFLQCRQCSVMQWFQPAALLCLHYSFHLPLLVSFLCFLPSGVYSLILLSPIVLDSPTQAFPHSYFPQLHSLCATWVRIHVCTQCRHCYKWSRIEWLRFKIAAHTLPYIETLVPYFH